VFNIIKYETGRKNTKLNNFFDEEDDENQEEE
jgi:hypothetical protein